MCLLASSHPHILISWGSCMLACILASSRPHILRFLCICLLSLCHIPRFVCVCLYPRILTSSYPQVHTYLLVSLHPHILRFMCVSFYPCILSSSIFLYIILIYISQTNICINTLKKIMQFTIQQKNKTTQYWTQDWNKSLYACIQVLHTYIHIIFKKGFAHSIFFAI